jgi:hypothetical protein
MAKHPSLTSVDLSGNTVPAGAITALCGAVSAARGLAFLGLAGIFPADSGALLPPLPPSPPQNRLSRSHDWRSPRRIVSRRRPGAARRRCPVLRRAAPLAGEARLLA